MKPTVKKIAFTTLAAAAAGYLAGILTAPKSGKETRKDIKDTAKRSYTEAEKQLKILHTELSQTLEEAKTKLGTLNGKARDELDAAMNVAKQGKDKARHILSAVHEGEAEDKDLQVSIEEARASLEHLKKYLTK
ncbi:MAG: YtxH domain-containing protein [Candidatus Saccharimonadales bacterium]|jgi:gas vesicle protein